MVDRVPTYSAEQSRAIDAQCLSDLGLSGTELMARAAAAALDELLDSWPDAVRLAVVCGKGN